MRYSTIDVAPCTIQIGAEIAGVDLSRPLEGQQLEDVKSVLADYCVIFFRNQKLDHEAHKSLGRQFGELAIHSGVAPIDGHKEIVAIHADANSKFIAGENWHSDLTCDAEPPMGSLLYLHTVPPVGGDTVFASMYAAYEALSPRMKSYLDGMNAVHDGEHVYRSIVNDPTKRFPCSTHPIVRTHPVTGRKCLFINASYTTHIVGVPKDESDAVLGYLYRHCTNPNFHIRFRWTPGTLAFWDNRCTQHLAVWDYFPQTRSGYRVTVAGDKPY